MESREAKAERIIDRRIMARLRTDRAYLNAENDEDAVRREEEIEEQEIEQAALEGLLDFEN